MIEISLEFGVIVNKVLIGKWNRRMSKRHVSVSIICYANVIVVLSQTICCYSEWKWQRFRIESLEMIRYDQIFHSISISLVWFWAKIDQKKSLLFRFVLFAMAKRRRKKNWTKDVYRRKCERYAKGGLISVTYDIYMVCAKHDVIHTFARSWVCM